MAGSVLPRCPEIGSEGRYAVQSSELTQGETETPGLFWTRPPQALVGQVQSLANGGFGTTSMA